MQHLVPGRHGRIFDADVKIVGACLGIASAMAVNLWARRRRGIPEAALAFASLAATLPGRTLPHATFRGLGRRH